jgi:hypothetical protein
MSIRIRPVYGTSPADTSAGPGAVPAPDRFRPPQGGFKLDASTLSVRP